MKPARWEYSFLPLLILATFALYGQSLGGWWTHDDPQILKQAHLFSPLEYFFIPEVWHTLSSSNLTPWVTLSFDFDLSLFGFNPQFFYGHQLLVIAGISWLIYLIARIAVAPLSALAGALLFLVGSPIAVATQQLMVRHYVEGLFFYLLSLWFTIYHRFSRNV